MGLVFEHILRDQVQLITRQQALAAGLTVSQIRTHVATGRWRPAYAGHHGVYVVGWGLAPMTHVQQVWAALLAVGGTVVVSHESAVWLARRHGPAPQPVHLAVVDGRCIAPIPGVRVHTLPSLGPEIVDWRLTPSRVRPAVAVIDAAHLCRGTREALTVVYAAANDRNIGIQSLSDALVARKRHRHRAALSAVLLDAGGGAMSGLERGYLKVMARHGLPRGVSQVKAAGPTGTRYVDVLVTEGLDAPLVTELDGRLGHELIGEVWRDMDRDNLDEESGRGHLRYGPAQVFGESCRVAGQVGRSLQRRGWVGAAVACGPGCTAPPRPAP